VVPVRSYHAVLIAVQAVHTTGINWTSIIVIAVSVTGIVGGFTKWILSSLKTGRKEQSDAIMTQVKMMIESQTAQTKLITDAIEHRLTSVDSHLDRQDATQAHQGQDIARIQGMLTPRKNGQDMGS
jgi:hypothetical protein